MNKEEIMKAIENLPHIEIDNKRPISAFNSVDIKDIEKVIDSMNENKTYIDLVKENKQLKKQVDRYKRLIEYLKCLDLYEFELDYDYEENPVSNYYPADIGYHINNWLEIEEIDKGSEE